MTAGLGDGYRGADILIAGRESEQVFITRSYEPDNLTAFVSCPLAGGAGRFRGGARSGRDPGGLFSPLKVRQTVPAAA